MVPADEIDAVVFDMGGVFTIQNPVMIGATLAAAGVDVTLGDAAARRGHYHGVRAWTDALSEPPEEGASPWQQRFDRAYLAAVGLEGGELETALAARTAARPHDDVTSLWSHALAENIEGFRQIVSRRPAAIVTNNVGTAVEQCANIDLCQVGPGPLTEVAAIVDSTIEGVAKPDPAIFTPALQALDTEPSRTVYVGDTVHADVRGAAAAGMVPIQLDPFDLHADHSHWRIADLPALALHLS